MRAQPFAAAMFVLAICIFPAPASAQCSTSDQQVLSQDSKASLGALMSGDLKLYQALEQGLPAKLSPSCSSVLAQLQPVRVKCTSEEKRRVLGRYQKAIQAALNVDAMNMIGQMQAMERDVTPACWLAVNRHTDPSVLRACNAKELDHLASMASPALQASKIALTTSDMGPMMKVSQQITAPLSQACGQALMALQPKPQPNPYASPKKQMPGNVIDHGGGNYSVPGLGACTSSGCMAF